MDDLLKLLDGSTDDVKKGLAGKSNDDLLKLKSAEIGGKTRKGVLDAIEAALSGSDAARAGGIVQVTASTTVGLASALDTSGPADVGAASEFSPSGAPRQVTDIDVDHPAVDNNPRAGTTANQNRIDFNDPTISGQEAVERALQAQG